MSNQKGQNRQKNDRPVDLKKVVVTQMTRSNNTVGLRGLRRRRA